LRTCLFILLFCCPVAVVAQPRAVQIFTVTEFVSMFVSPGELGIDQNGILWFGSDNKLISFDGFHYNSYALPQNIRPYTDHSQLEFNHQDRQGKYWSFINNNGLYRFEPGGRLFKAIPFSPGVLQHIDPEKLTAKFLLEDSKGNLWISLNGYGLLCVAAQTGKQQFYPINDSLQKSNYVSATWLNKGIETASGELYFGSNDGMVKFNGAVLEIYKDTSKKKITGGHCIITGMAPGVDPAVLVLSSWAGAIRTFNIKTKSFKTFLAQPDNGTGEVNIINDVLRLTDSTYFFIKRDSLARSGFGIFNINTKQYRYLQKLEPVYVSREYFSIVQSGDFAWVANINQLYRFYIPALKNNEPLNLKTHVPPGSRLPVKLYLGRLWINEKERRLSPAGLDLANQENNLRARFAVTGATQFDSILFAYRLKGYEQQWHNTYTPQLQYNSLPPGDYRLEIKVERSFSNVSVNTVSIPICIAARWWQTAWFKLLLLLAFAASALFIYRQRSRSIRDKAAIKSSYEKKISEVEMKALRAQMNPHFIFNCLNSINRYIVKSDHITASNYLTRFSKLIRRILDNSASGIITLDTEMETLDLYVQMEAMRFHNRFSYNIVAGETIDRHTTLIPSMLLQPYVENAIWHGLLHKISGDCRLDIQFQKTNENLMCVTIEDNGVGRKAAILARNSDTFKSRPQGMAITGERLELIKSLYGITATCTITDLYGEDGSAAGTRVVICLPLLYNHTPNK